MTTFEHLTGKSVSARVFWWGICGFFVVASFRAWRDQYRVAKEPKKTPIQRRPEVFFTYDPTRFNIHGKQECFSLANRGTADAFNVGIENMVNENCTMVWEIIPTIPTGKSVPAMFDILVDGALSPMWRNNAGVFLEAKWKTKTRMEDYLLKIPIFVHYEDIDNNRSKMEFGLTYNCIKKNLDILFRKLYTNTPHEA